MAMLRGEPHYVKSIRRKCLDRFWRRVDDADGDANQCWIYNGTSANHGYGNFWYINEWQTDPKTGRPRKRYITAHRFSALIEPRLGEGINEEGIVVMHQCDQKACVNPHHLKLGTQKANVQDCWNKQRHPITRFPGAENPFAVLHEHQVLEIRARHARGDITYVALAREYGVSESAIARCCKRETWKHI